MNRRLAFLQWPARWLVPLFIVLLALIMLGFRYVDQMRGAMQDVSSSQSALLRERLSLEQARLDLIDGADNPLLQRRLVSGLALYDNVSLAYLVDATGQVDAALSRQDVGRALPEALALQIARHPEAEQLQTQQMNASVHVQQPSGTSVLIGVAPLKNARTLLVLAELDRPLAQRHVAIRAEVLQEGAFLLVGAGLLAAFLHLFWFRRARRLMEALARMGAGDLSVRTDLTGKDELARIGQAADGMATALQTEQARLRHVDGLVNRSPVVVIEWRNAPGWPVSYVSASVDQWGYSPAQLLHGDLQYNDLFHPDDVERVNQEIAGYFADGPDTYQQEYRIRCGDGRWAWVDDRTNLKRDASGEVESISGVLLDITEQKLAQLAQREQAELLRLFFELPFTGMAITSPQDKRWLQVNDRLCQILGYKREVLLQKTWADITHPDDLQANVCLFNQLVAGETTAYQMNKRFLRADGIVVFAAMDVRSVRHADGSLKHLFTTIHDVTERLQAEQALLDKERLLAEAQRVASLGNWNLDLQSGEALWSSEEYRLLGYEPDTVEPTLDHFMQAVHPEDRARVQSAMQRAMSPVGDHDYQVEHRVVHGTVVRHLEQRGRVDFDDQDRPLRMFGTTLDVTERKVAEAEMRRSEERYTLAARIGGSGAWEMWPQEGKIFFDANLTRLLGYEADEMSENLADWYVTVPEDARAGLEAALQAVIDGRADSYRIEHPVRHKDGSTGWLLAQGRRVSPPGEVPLRLVGSSLDITERKQASQILLDLKDMLEKAETVSHLGSWAFDSDTGHLRWSPQMFRNMGMPWSEAPPSIDAYCERIHPDDVKPVRAAIDRLVRGEEVPTVVFRTHPAYGPVRWMRRTVQRMPREAEGKGPRYIGVLLDITEAMEADERLRHINEELERRVAERTEQLSVANRELEAFSYTVSHDLKAPLRGIDGYSQLLVDEYGARLDEEGREFVLRIRHGVRQMGELISDLLEYSRMERRDMAAEEVALQPLVRTILDGYHADIQKQGTQVDLTMEELILPLDREGMSVVLRNLIGNALKFSQESAEPAIEIGSRSEPGRRILWVRDNGVGFDMKYHDRIFGIFQRLHRAEQFAGTGVGLALVAKAVSRMGGRVWAESEPGAGATFFLEFPE